MSAYQANAILVLETGEWFLGQAMGKFGIQAQGCLCFNTALTGYQEAISDPSYAGQILVFTAPHIGNVGVNVDDRESQCPVVQGLVFSDISDWPSNHRSESTLSEYLKNHGIFGIFGVDTRSLVKCIRASTRPIKALISHYDEKIFSKIRRLQQKAASGIGLDKLNWRSFVGTKSEEWREGLPEISSLPLVPLSSGIRVVVIDFGVKWSILRMLKSLGCQVWRVPFDADLSVIQKIDPQAVVLSNGPGDPRAMAPEVLETIKHLIHQGLPILGICLGYQLLALLYGAEILKLPCGHHGNNHPVKVLDSDEIWITSQNHEFAVSERNMPPTLIPSHRSLFDGSLEGFTVKDKPIMGVQFHPEAGPGPADAGSVFQKFYAQTQ